MTNTTLPAPLFAALTRLVAALRAIFACNDLTDRIDVFLAEADPSVQSLRSALCAMRHELTTSAACQRRDAICGSGRDNLNTLAAFGLFARAAEWLTDALDAMVAAADQGLADRFAIEALRFIDDAEQRAAMSVDRAREITRGVLRTRLVVMGVWEEEGPCKLPAACSLEEMLVACRIVGGEAGKTRTTKPDGTVTTTILSTVDPRGVALAYVAEHYAPEDIVGGLDLTVSAAKSLRDWLTERIDEATAERDDEGNDG